MTTSLAHLTIAQARAGLKKKAFSSVELTQAYLTRMEQHKGLNAYITETPEQALAEAKAADARIAAGNDNGLLDGVPMGIKDLFCTNGVKTTAASNILGNFIPPYESTVTSNMRKQGMVMLGKLNLDQFAMGSANITSAFGNVISPWKRTGETTELVPGGSSGGSSAAVSAFLCAGATGTDTGGSIRQPAAFTGIYGIKPTYGRCSRWGVIAFASSLDQAGSMARSVEDCALMLESMAGFDPKDSTSANQPVPAWSREINTNLKGKKIGIPKEYMMDSLPAEIRGWIEKTSAWLKDAGAEIVEVSLPHTHYALPTYYIIAPAECSSNLARYDGVRFGHRTAEKVTSLDDMYELTRAEGFGEEVKRRILVGTYVLSHGYYDAYYIKAQRVRRLIANDFSAAFEKVDALLTPSTPSSAFGINEKISTVEMYMNDVFTVPASLAGLPGMSVPVGLDAKGLPLGVQILGNLWDEQTVFNVAATIEKASGFNATPTGF